MQHEQDHTSRPEIQDSRLPFAGLGFDLAPVRAKAARLRLRPVGVKQMATTRLPAAPVYRRHGYALMAFLCRETGGS
jgi:hypothetical protein